MAIKLDNVFDSIAEEYVNKEKGEGAVIMGVYSEEMGIGYHAACGELATIVALIAAIIERAVKDTVLTPHDLLEIISNGYEV